MQSGYSFTGISSRTRKIMQQVEYEYLNGNSKKLICSCVDNINEKYATKENASNMSNKRRISQILRTSVGGTVNFGNYYLGEPPVINYLGRVPGQPGGAGSPPKNKF